MRCGLLNQAAKQVVGEFEGFFADAELLALRGRQAISVVVGVGVILTGIGIELGQQPTDAEGSP